MFIPMLASSFKKPAPTQSETLGKVWTNNPTQLTLQGINGIRFLKGRFIIVCNGGVVLHSVDGVTWTTKTNVLNTSAVYDVGYDPDGGMVVFVGSSGRLAYTYDFTNWSSFTTTNASTSSNRGIGYGAGMWVIIGDSGKLMSTSTPHVSSSWATLTNPTGLTTSGYNVEYGNGNFVVSHNQAMIRSTDGVNFSLITEPVTQQIRSLSFDADSNIWLLATSTSQLYGSDDNWTSFYPITHPFATNASFRSFHRGAGIDQWIITTILPTQGIATMLNPADIATDDVINTGRGYVGAAYGNGMWVAVTADGYISTSV